MKKVFCFQGENAFTKKGQVSLVEVMILIVGLFAFSYAVGSSVGFVSGAEDPEPNWKRFCGDIAKFQNSPKAGYSSAQGMRDYVVDGAADPLYSTSIRDYNIPNGFTETDVVKNCAGNADALGKINKDFLDKLDAFDWNGIGTSNSFTNELKEKINGDKALKDDFLQKVLGAGYTPGDYSPTVESFEKGKVDGTTDIKLSFGEGKGTIEFKGLNERGLGEKVSFDENGAIFETARGKKYRADVSQGGEITFDEKGIPYLKNGASLDLEGLEGDFSELPFEKIVLEDGQATIKAFGKTIKGESWGDTTFEVDSAKSVLSTLQDFSLDGVSVDTSGIRHYFGESLPVGLESNSVFMGINEKSGFVDELFANKVNKELSFNQELFQNGFKVEFGKGSSQRVSIFKDGFFGNPSVEIDPVKGILKTPEGWTKEFTAKTVDGVEWGYELQADGSAKLTKNGKPFGTVKKTDEGIGTFGWITIGVLGIGALAVLCRTLNGDKDDEECEDDDDCDDDEVCNEDNECVDEDEEDDDEDDEDSEEDDSGEE